MKNTIDNWYGRLGNNIQQISNAIFFCKENGINFYGPPHDLIRPFKINFGIDKDISNRFFFFEDVEKDFNCDTEKLNIERREICLKYIVPNFNFFIKEPFDDETLIIHIRSGDIFSVNPHKSYIPNPLSFYEKIIDKYEEVIIVTEDYNNPITKILQKNKKVLIQISDIKNDFSTLLRARNLVSSGVGTFCVAAALCSKNIKNFYCTNIFITEHLNPIMLKLHLNVIETKIENYIKIGEWNCSNQQIKKILEWK